MYIYDVKRLPFGKYKGNYKDLDIFDLVKLLNIPREEYDLFSLACTRTAGYGPALARHMSYINDINADSVLINNACASSLYALIDIIERNKKNSIVVAAESMSTANKIVTKDGDTVSSNIVDGFICGITKEKMLDQAIRLNKFTRNELDYYTYLMYDRAFKNKLKFKNIIKNNYLNYDQRIEEISFKKITDEVSINNSKLTKYSVSNLADGAGYIIVGLSKKSAIAEIIDYDISFSDPTETIYSAIKSIKKMLNKHKDVDFYEIHDGFANCGLELIKQCNIDINRLNIFGSSISIGHPIAVTGLRLIQHAVEVMQRMNANKVLVSTPSSGGVGITLILKKGM